MLSSTPTQDRRKAELLGKAFTEGCGTGGPSETSPAPVQPEEDEELTEQERGSKLAAVNSAFAEKSSRQEARQIMKTTGRLFFRAVMVDGANDNEAEDAGHAIQLACLEDSVVADYFRSRGVGFASLALMVVHCVAVAARTKKDTGGNISGSAHTVSEPSASAGAGAAEQSHSAAMFEGRIRVAFCCDKFRTKFFAKSGDSQGSLRVQLRQDGIYATASSVARRDSDRLEDGTGGVEWQRLLQPEVDYVRRGKVPNIFATTPQYSTICPHISGSLQFLSSYLKAPIGANINIMPSKKVDLIDGRLRVTLTQELAPEPPAWYPAEHVLQSQPCGNITSCDVVSVRTRSGPEGTPLVGVLAACPPIRPQGEAKYELYANILWDKLSQGPRHVEAIDVTTTGSLPVWDLLRVLALSTPLDPEQFARRTEAGQRTGFEQARTQEDALESAMTLLQFSEVQKHTVSQFAALRGSGSEADGKISLQPGECALVTTSVPRIACRSESRGPDVEINVGEPDREMGGLFLDMKRLDDSRVERFLYLSPTFTAFIMEAGNVRDG